APAWLMGEALVRGCGLRRGCIWAFLLVSAEWGVIMLLAGPHLGERLTHDMNVYSSQFIAQMRGQVPAEQIEEWTELFKNASSTIAAVYPAAFIIAGGVGVVLNGLVVRA